MFFSTTPDLTLWMRHLNEMPCFIDKSLFDNNAANMIFAIPPVIPSYIPFRF